MQPYFYNQAPQQFPIYPQSAPIYYPQPISYQQPFFYVQPPIYQQPQNFAPTPYFYPPQQQISAPYYYPPAPIIYPQAPTYQQPLQNIPTQSNNANYQIQWPPKPQIQWPPKPEIRWPENHEINHQTQPQNILQKNTEQMATDLKDVKPEDAFLESPAKVPKPKGILKPSGEFKHIEAGNKSNTSPTQFAVEYFRDRGRLLRGSKMPSETPIIIGQKPGSRKQSFPNGFDGAGLAEYLLSIDVCPRAMRAIKGAQGPSSSPDTSPQCGKLDPLNEMLKAMKEAKSRR